ncbi:hypothetical protein MRB53_002685 [Persea americana]|uniref:Uncharacterized protein n=1 Tax=Persea americana TaxID=3435 RepID=A0ACC2MV24_PERAE|nr:hypothetical protein MRB53_002685 [Persea americana]
MEIGPRRMMGIVWREWREREGLRRQGDGFYVEVASASERWVAEDNEGERSSMPWLEIEMESVGEGGCSQRLCA